MKPSTAAACAGALLLLALPSAAQRSEPAGVQRAEVSGVEASTPVPTRRDTVTDAAGIRVIHGVVGGLLGAVGGAFIGGVIGMTTESEPGTLFMLGVGQSIGVAVGTHEGTRGRGNVALSALASFGILLVTARNVHVSSPALYTVVPALQVATALAIELYQSRPAAGGR